MDWLFGNVFRRHNQRDGRYKPRVKRNSLSSQGIIEMPSTLAENHRHIVCPLSHPSLDHRIWAKNRAIQYRAAHCEHVLVVTNIRATSSQTWRLPLLVEEDEKEESQCWNWRRVQDSSGATEIGPGKMWRRGPTRARPSRLRAI